MTIPDASRLTMGTKCSSSNELECFSEISRKDSTALSRTTVSSTVARFSRGGLIILYDEALFMKKLHNEYVDWYQETVDKFRSANKRREIAKLFGQSEQHLVFVINCV